MTDGRLPHGRSASAFESAWFEFRRYLSGPLGCLVALLCLPFALLALLVLAGVAMWKGRKLRAAIQGQLDAERGAGDAVPVAQFVRVFAADPSFTREEATLAAVPAASGKSARELLDEAIRRGWIEETGGGLLVVSERGRTETDALLRARGL
jgi:hypothetical protein